MGQGCSARGRGPTHPREPPDGALPGPLRPLWPLSLHRLPATALWLCLLPHPGSLVLRALLLLLLVAVWTNTACPASLWGTPVWSSSAFSSLDEMWICVSKCLFRTRASRLKRKKQGSWTLPFLFMMFSGVLVFPEAMRMAMGSSGARSVR